MKPSILYRIAAVLLVLFAVGHTVGFSQIDPVWGVDATVAAMKSIRFDMMGSPRTLWEFYLAAGYSVGVFYLFSAVLAWQLGGLPTESLTRLRLSLWAFALAFVAILAVSVTYLFIIPIVFSALISLVLIAAAWASSRQRTT